MKEANMMAWNGKQVSLFTSKGSLLVFGRCTGILPALCQPHASTPSCAPSACDFSPVCFIEGREGASKDSNDRNP
jgi:hypothetical protein